MNPSPHAYSQLEVTLEFLQEAALLLQDYVRDNQHQSVDTAPIAQAAADIQSATERVHEYQADLSQ